MSTRDALVRVHAFDLRAFYDREGLGAGDYLEAAQNDTKGLSFSLSARKAASIDAKERTLWLAALAKGFSAAMKELGAPGDNAELIRAAYEAVPPSAAV